MPPLLLHPLTLLLPNSFKFASYVKKRRLAAVKNKKKSPTYIVKPSGGSQGTGIMLLQHEGRLPPYDMAVSKIPSVAQIYVAPLLFEGIKFDLRVYILVRSVDPLEIYVHREGLSRFCTASCVRGRGGQKMRRRPKKQRERERARRFCVVKALTPSVLF